MIDYYNVENPAYADACIYGNRFPITKRHYEEDDLEEVFGIYFGIDTSKLTSAEEWKLIEELENLKYVDEIDKYDYDRDENWFEVTWRELPEFEDKDLYGYVEVKGYAKESIYDDIYDVVESYDVHFTEKISS